MTREPAWPARYAHPCFALGEYYGGGHVVKTGIGLGMVGDKQFRVSPLQYKSAVQGGSCWSQWVITSLYGLLPASFLQRDARASSSGANLNLP